MPKFLYKRWHGQHLLWGFILLLVLTAVLSIFEWILGVIALLLVGGWMYYVLAAEKAFRKELQQYIMTLSYRIKKVGSEVINGLPIGMILYNEQHEVEWHNPFIGDIFDRESMVGESLLELLPELRQLKDEPIEVQIAQDVYRIEVKTGERMLYFFNITDYAELSKRYEAEKISLGLLMLDNFDEATQSMDDQTRSVLLAKIVSEITEWCNKHQAFLKRLASDRFLLVMDQTTLKSMEQSRFDILDEVRDITAEYKLPFTLSIGIASGSDQLVELGQLAQTSLDIALGRGGDQVAVKVGERLSFYGGKSNAVEKRTRVRARVISHAMRDLIRDSDKVIIMGHRNPDMDSVGAAIGVLKAAHLAGKEGYIVIEAVNPGISRLMEQVREYENIFKWIITPEQAMHITTSRSLIVVVDTHKPSMVAEPKLLQATNRIVVIDHHRRGEEVIQDAILVYMEPYASSTSELVTELLQYFRDRISIEPFEATALLAGIAVDTKSFSLRTGARTFEAASFLRRNGADTSLVQNLLKEDLEQFNKKAEIISRAKVYYERIAIAKGESGQQYSQLQIAQAADALLNISNIVASFTICERTDGDIGISARSLGQINVQIIMERLGGGGHLTNAAVQLEGTIDDAEEKLLGILQEMIEEERLFK